MASVAEPQPEICQSVAATPKTVVASGENPRAQPALVGLWIVLWLASAVAICANRAEADLWGHVLYGQDVLAAGHLPKSATYTYTAVGHPWINHENLSELTFAALANVGGGPALMAFKTLLGLALFGALILRARRQHVEWIVAAVVLILVAINLTGGWSIRPQIFTYTFFAVLVTLLDRCEQRRVWWVVPLMALWANTHGGFVAGYCILVLYLVCRSVETLWAGDKSGMPTRRRHGTRTRFIVCRYAAVCAAAGLATLLNPYGYELLLWLKGALQNAPPEITEWARLAWRDDAFIPFVALAGVTLAALVGSRRKRDLTQCVVLAVTACQAIAHSRHVPFFALLVGLWLPPHVQSLWQRVRRPGEEPQSGPSLTLRAATLLVAASLAVVLVVRSRDVVVDKSEFPVDALQFMAERQLQGKLLVTFNWAQYAIAALRPNVQVAFDGRFDTCYPRDVLDMHFDFVLGDAPGLRRRGPSSPPLDATRALNFGHPNLALISHRTPNALAVMQQAADWVLLYQDALAQVWGRRERYDDPRSPDFIPPALRHISDQPQSGFVSWPALPATPTEFGAVSEASPFGRRQVSDSRRRGEGGALSAITLTPALSQRERKMF